MTTKVIFRVDEREGRKEVIAFFPRMVGDMNPYRTCSCYAHVGQHSSASADFQQWTRPATEDEYKPLLRELISIGYDDLKISKRVTRDDLEERKLMVRIINHTA